MCLGAQIREAHSRQWLQLIKLICRVEAYKNRVCAQLQYNHTTKLETTVLASH